MKKKIINGILMAAMLFAGTTSFVSCKDNVDDVATSIYKDLDKVKSDLQLQIDALSGRVSTLEGKVSTLEGKVSTLESKVSNLETEVAQIKNDIAALTSRVGNLEEEQAKLKERMAAAEAKIAELEEYVNSAIYDVKVEETIDAVIGTINLPFLHVPTLMSYYGLNASGITTFPTKKSSVHVYNNDGGDASLVNGQYASQIDPFMDGVSPIRFEGLGAQLAQYTNNVGKIYFSLNPVGVDITGVTFDIVDSKGNVYPYEISDVKSSDHSLTIAAGKHGEIINEGESTNQYLYEANVHLPMAKWEQAISYNIEDTWKSVGDISDVKTMLQKAKTAYQTEGKAAASKVLLKEALQWIQNKYQQTYTDKYKMKYQALRATGKVNVAKSNTQIVVAAIEPLSYKTFWMLDQDGRALIKSKFDIESIEKGIAILAKAIVKAIPNVKLNQITITSATISVPTGEAYFVVSDGTTGNSNAVAVPLGAYAISDLADAINSGNKQLQDYVNDYIKKINNKISAVTNPDVDNVMAKANNFLNKVIAKFVNLTGDKFFMNCVTPIVLFEGNEGIDRLQPGMTVEVLNNRMTAILTSPTEEYLVPAMYKYIAVRQGDKIVDSKVLSGQDKVIALDLKEGECEIIYQTVDYSGYVVTKSYPVTVKCKY